MSTSENNAQAFVDLLPAKQRQAIVNVFGDKFARQFMGPIAFIDDAKLSSPTAINFFRRDFQFISKVLNYEYQYRSWNGFDQTLLDRLRRNDHQETGEHWNPAWQLEQPLWQTHGSQR